MPELRGSTPPKGAKTWDEAYAPGAPARPIFQAWGASGLAGVWAEENSREAIYAAMRRKETFATSGPRIKVRFFAGYDFPADVMARTLSDGLSQQLGQPVLVDNKPGAAGLIGLQELAVSPVVAAWVGMGVVIALRLGAMAFRITLPTYSERQ